MDPTPTRSFDQASFLFCYCPVLLTPSVVFCCCSPSASKFETLCLQRRYSTFLDCNKMLFELLFSSYYQKPVCPFSSYPRHQQGIFDHTGAAHRMFSLFRNILCKP
ncbi:hypothetical protein GOODEAATRI_012179 [Goodea atripinnis]|uniref:Secreted protein n=1 Tax=Goodea atripinnis TaxID=208336 RepID=A0ABV0PXE3_9TELE